MTAIGLLHSVHGQQTKSVDGQLIEGCFRECRSHAYIVPKGGGSKPFAASEKKQAGVARWNHLFCLGPIFELIPERNYGFAESVPAVFRFSGVFSPAMTSVLTQFRDIVWLWANVSPTPLLAENIRLPLYILRS
jgi:hypothetical protein